MAPNIQIGPHYLQAMGEDGKPIISFNSKGIECATFEPETFYDLYDYCVVIKPDRYYPSYREFIREHCWLREDDWVEEEPPLKDRVYKIIECAPHHMYSKQMIYIIEDMDTGQIYIIGEDGIKVCEKYTGLLNNITTGVDEPITTWGSSKIIPDTEGILSVDFGAGVDYCRNDVLMTTKYEDYVSRYIKGEQDFPTIKKGEMEMKNEVLELYAKREKEKIVNKFKAMKEEKYNNLEAVKRYNEVINTFKASLAELVDEYKNEEEKVFVKTVYEDHFGYEINPYLETQIAEKFREDYEADIKELDDKVAEIRAVLSLSTDVEYQRGVLVEYGILNKKGVMVNE